MEEKGKKSNWRSKRNRGWAMMVGRRPLADETWPRNEQNIKKKKRKKCEQQNKGR